MQIEVVTAKFRGGCHGYYFSPNGHQLHLGDKVIVETEKGKDIVTISKEAELIDASQLAEPLKNVLKAASKHEIQEGEENFKKGAKSAPRNQNYSKRGKSSYESYFGGGKLQFLKTFSSLYCRRSC